MASSPVGERGDGCRHAPAARDAKQARTRARSNTMTLSRLQLPPRPLVRRQLDGRSAGDRDLLQLAIREEPDESAVRRPERERPASVPGIGRAARLATGRSQIRYADWAPATKAMFRPSGDTATCVALPVPPAAGPPKTVVLRRRDGELHGSGAIVPERDIRQRDDSVAIIAIDDSAATQPGDAVRSRCHRCRRSGALLVIQHEERGRDVGDAPAAILDQASAQQRGPAAGTSDGSASQSGSAGRPRRACRSRPRRRRRVAPVSIS